MRAWVDPLGPSCLALESGSGGFGTHSDMNSSSHRWNLTKVLVETARGPETGTVSSGELLREAEIGHEATRCPRPTLSGAWLAFGFGLASVFVQGAFKVVSMDMVA